MFDKKLLPQKVREIIPYAVDKNSYKIRLDANESFIAFPEAERDKINAEILNQGLNRYPDCEAKRLCKAFSEYYGINENSVIAGNGSDEIISILMNTFANSGDSVGVFDVEFSMYAFYASLAELNVVTIPKKADFHIDFELTRKCLRENNIKLFIFSNPCNPTGIREEKKSLEALIREFPKTVFVADEAYMDFSDKSETESFLRETEDYNNLVVLKTLSKAFGCAALRVGFLVGDSVTRDAFFKVKSPYNLNTLSQTIASVVLENKKSAAERTEKIRKAKKYLTQGLKKLENENFMLIPSDANFVFIKAKNAADIYKRLLEMGISIRCFKLCGGALRITAGTNEETDELLSSLERVVE